jgi:hypothetical protein
MFKIKLISTNYVHENEEYFNTNHHFTYNDYEDVIKKTEFKQYVYCLNREFVYVDLSLNDCRTILNACASGVITLKPPRMYQEEIEAISKKITLPYNNCFIRLERCSLKDTCYGTGPYTNSIDVINGLCTSYRCYNYIKKCVQSNMQVRLYILPWISDIKENNEFRIFVYNKNITGISEYNIFKHSIDFQIDWEKIIFELKNIVSLISSKTELITYTMDVCLINDKVLLLELNSFGAGMAAGSSLFNWIADHDQLHGSTNYIEIRLVTS